MIRLLDAATVGQIAAGEVVERPLSVVKELVENALDAGAARVAVSLVRGGLESIVVADDGSGIAREDLRLALARHATSKLRDAAELERVATLGFRGEGLASIAAVARVHVASRTRDADVAFALDAFGESVGEPEPVALPRGTRVTVRDLFANVPVRREFLRAPRAEFARVSTFLATLSLGYPQVTFSLEHDGRRAFVFPAAERIEQRLAHVFGPQPARELLPLDGAVAGVARVGGFVNRPGFERGDRRAQVLFVNKRLLRSTLLAGAWTAGYATYTLVGRHPYGVLFLDLAPEHVDPNVHPTKSDVRLRRPNEVHDAVRHAIAGALQHDARVRASVSFGPPLESALRAQRPEREASVARAPSRETTPNAAAPFAFVTNAAPDLRVLAQLDDTFVLATDGDALVLVDQHAAHERIAYETIARRARDGGPTEPLLLPYAIELDAADAARFEAAREDARAAGLDAEPFGERAYRILATPAGYGARAFDVRGYLADLGDDVPGLSARERVWASLACHSVVRAGERLDVAEMAALLARLVRCENPMHCPHGRPTIVRIEADAIARMFKR